MTILEAVVAELSLPHYLNTHIKDLSFKILSFHQNMIPVTAGQARIFAFNYPLSEPHLDWFPCLPDTVPWALSMVIRVRDGSRNLKLGFDLVPLCYLSGVTSITLPNTGLFAALAFAATNAEMSFMLGLLPDC